MYVSNSGLCGIGTRSLSCQEPPYAPPSSRLGNLRANGKTGGEQQAQDIPPNSTNMRGMMSNNRRTKCTRKDRRVSFGPPCFGEIRVPINY
jgi:hypothetical protein